MSEKEKANAKSFLESLTSIGPSSSSSEEVLERTCCICTFRDCLFYTLSFGIAFLIYFVLRIDRVRKFSRAYWWLWLLFAIPAIVLCCVRGLISTSSMPKDRPLLFLAFEVLVVSLMFTWIYALLDVLIDYLFSPIEIKVPIEIGGPKDTPS